MKKYVVILVFILGACAQSRKGIQGAKTDWVWGAAEFCSKESWQSNCSYSNTFLTGALHYDSNYMDFRVNRIAPKPIAELASDESVTYRIRARRANETTWHLMKILDVYSGATKGASENMQIIGDTSVHLAPYVGYIEQYTEWVLELVIAKGTQVQYQTLFDVTVDYAETHSN